MTKKNIIKYMLASMIFIAGAACKKQLQVGNPNQPTFSGNVTSFAGLAAFTQGATYINGFVNGDGWLGNSYFSLPYGYAELLADNVGADAANQAISVVSIPDKVTNPDGTFFANPGTNQIPFLRSYNTRANTGAGNNALYYQWLNMYALNNAENTVLYYIPTVSSLTTDQANTFKAWAYFWKGYAYASIGTMYYSGLIVDTYNGASNVYKVHDSIIARSNYYYNLAATTLAAITSVSDYTTTLTALVPTDFVKGHGGIPTIAMFTRNINTMLARNIILNKLNPFVNNVVGATISKSTITPMQASDWASVLSLANNGIQQGDIVFSGHAGATNAVFSPGSGSVAAMTAGTNTNSTFKITERFIQNYNPADARLTTNFTFNNTTPYGNGGTFATRWSLNKPTTPYTGVVTLGSVTAGVIEVYIAGSYEENALMIAEASIMTGAINNGLIQIDAVRAYQGAGSGVPKLAGTSLTTSQAMAALTAERRVALVFRGVAFYDARRWGWTYNTSNGGGYYNGVYFVSTASPAKIYTTSVFNYDFLDYWDVPADESVLNPPGSGSAAIVNPNF